MEKTNIVLAAGGTGGHIFPAHALAEKLFRENYNPILLTDKRYFKYTNRIRNLHIEIILAATPYCTGVKRLLSSLIILIGVIQAVFLLKKYKPEMVIGFGGYPAFPTLFAAKMLKIPIIIHEQNSALGRANKYFVNTAKYIATSFQNTAGLKDISKEKIHFTGNPVRENILEISNLPYPKIIDKLNILIIGGSQGAAIFSQVIPNALQLLTIDMQLKLRITQQCIKDDVEKLNLLYKDTILDVDISSFFEDMHNKLKDAHLVITRAGASTIAELEAAARPAIIVPIPNSFDNHQLHNARSFVEKNKGWIIPQENFTAQNLKKKLVELIDNNDILTNAANNFNFDSEIAVERLFKLIKYNLN